MTLSVLHALISCYILVFFSVDLISGGFATVDTAFGESLISGDSKLQPQLDQMDVEEDASEGLKQVDF